MLFRVAAEGHIRRYLIEECNYLDAVIGLPANIFYGTGIPTCIRVLKSSGKTPTTSSSSTPARGLKRLGNQNQLRPDDVERIVSTYRQRASVGKLSHVAQRSEVAENDFNLNIPRHVDTFNAGAQVDLAAVATKLGELEKAMGETDQVIAGFCAELGLKAPV